MKITDMNDGKITLEFGLESKGLVLKILKAELEKCRNELIHLKRVENDERYDGETTWWSGGCKVQPEYAANLMYENMEKWAALEDMIKQIKINTEYVNKEEDNIEWKR